MSKFKIGDKVIFSKGKLKDAKGTIMNPYWQVAANEYPEVIIEQADGTGIFVEIDNVRPDEDSYEYGATWLDTTLEDTYWDVYETEWGTLEEAQEEARHATEVGNKGVKIMRRLKAGEPEDFDV